MTRSNYLSKLINHSLNQFVQTHWFIRSQNKWLPLWVSHWITDSFNHTDLFKNEISSLCSVFFKKDSFTKEHVLVIVCILNVESSLSIKTDWAILQLSIYITVKTPVMSHLLSDWYRPIPSMFKLHSKAAAWLCLQRWEHYTYTPRHVPLLFQHIPVVTSCCTSIVLKPRLALFLISYTWFSLSLLLLPDSEKWAWSIKSVFTRELSYNASECYMQMNKTSPLTLPRRDWHHKLGWDLLS